MAKTVEAWDDPDFAAGRKTPADHRDVVFRIGDKVDVTLDLTDTHLAELIEHNARWIALAQAPPPGGTVSAAARRGQQQAVYPGGVTGHRHWRDVRRFAEATGRGDQIIRKGWKPEEGTKNKYDYPEALIADYAAWVAEGRPPLDGWRQRVS